MRTISLAVMMLLASAFGALAADMGGSSGTHRQKMHGKTMHYGTYEGRKTGHKAYYRHHRHHRGAITRYGHRAAMRHTSHATTMRAKKASKASANQPTQDQNPQNQPQNPSPGQSKGKGPSY